MEEERPNEMEVAKKDHESSKEKRKKKQINFLKIDKSYFIKIKFFAKF